MATRATRLLYDRRFLDNGTGLALVSATVPADSVWDPQAHAASPLLVSRQLVALRDSLSTRLKEDSYPYDVVS